MDAKELKKLIKLCKQEGVTSLKLEGVEIQLSPLAILNKKYKAEADEEIKPAFTEEDALYWSAPGEALNG